MIYYFRWEDILNGEIRRVERMEARGLDREVVFDWSEVAPTENLRVLVLNDKEEHLGEILLKR